MTDSLFELTSFQRDLLYVVVGETDISGQEIKAELETVMDEITHGRLYPNLDTLVEKGYVEKGELDRRTNYYQVTESGFEALQARRSWEDRYVDL